MGQEATWKTNAEVATAWGAGLSGEMGALAGVMSPDAAIWHSTDGEWLTREVAQARMAAPRADAAPALGGFGDVRAMATERGVLVQATIRRDDELVHIVQVLTVEDGKVTSVEEYIAPQGVAI